MSTIAMNLSNHLAGMLTLVADATTQPTTAPEGGFGSLLKSPIFPIMVVLIIFMLVSSRSKRKQDKQRQLQLSAMKRGDRVQTIGGILGTIVDVRDNEVVVKVDESNNTKIKFARTAVSKLVGEEDKAETK